MGMAWHPVPAAPITAKTHWQSAWLSRTRLELIMSEGAPVVIFQLQSATGGGQIWNRRNLEWCIRVVTIS